MRCVIWLPSLSVFSPQILIEKSLKGWKECEYEVVRDAADSEYKATNVITGGI